MACGAPFTASICKSGLKSLWVAQDPAFRTYASLATDGRHLLVAAASGELLLVDGQASQFRVRSRLTVFEHGDAELYAHPAIVGNRLYLRGENELVCVEMDAK